MPFDGPDALSSDPQADPDAFAQAAASAPVSGATALGTNFLYGASDLAERAGHLAGQLTRAPHVISAEEANANYGTDGLRFNAPVDEGDAAFRQHMAHRAAEAAFLDDASNTAPLASWTAGFAGGMADPVGLPLMLAGGGLVQAGKAGVAALRGAEAVGGGVDAAGAIVRGGRLANLAGVAAEGVASNVPYLGADYALRASSGDDVTLGEGLRDLALGAVFHTGLHYLGEAFGAAGRARAARRQGMEGDENTALDPADPFSSPPSPATADQPAPPAAVSDLSPEARQGAFLKALDDATDDRPVDVQRYIDRERATNGDLSSLDETTAAPSIDFKPLGEDTAVTPRGDDVPVRYGLAELSDLTTSHTNDLEPNPAFPQALQPRDRARAGAMARNRQLESDLNPKLLMRDVSAAAGAPIVAPDGTVESGNGRTIALRRSAGAQGDAYARYRAELEAQGFDTEGMRQPVLVRMRTDALPGPQRAALARDMNADVTERMSASEQAMSDAKRIDHALPAAPETAPLSDPGFVRAVLQHVAPDAANTLVDRDGKLSTEGRRRIQGALLARAYGDERLVAQVYEGEESPTRKLGEALADAAPAWAKMRAAAAVGDIPKALDATDALTSAMDLLREAARAREVPGDVLTRLREQGTLFGGEAVSPETEAFLRLFYRDARLTKPRAVETITAALKDYARQALDVTPGPDLFGGEANEDTARAILDVVADRFARNDPGPVDIVRPPGPSRSAAEGAASRPALLDLQPDGGAGDRPGPDGLRSDGGTSAGRGGDRPDAAAPASDVAGREGGKPSPSSEPAHPKADHYATLGDRFIAADPELRALQEANTTLAADRADALPAAPADQDPNRLATALRAAAVCMIGELG